MRYMEDKKTTPKKKAPAKKTAAKKRVAAKKVVSQTTAKAALSVPVFDEKGKEVRALSLPEHIFGVRRNDTLVYQVAVGMEANARASVAHTKGRGEVRGGGRKPWKQKGTGRARHGSSRSPIWRGGGVTHGPTSEKDYSQKINKKMRMHALSSALSAKLQSGELLFVDIPAMKEPKTKEVKALVASLANIKGFEALATRRNNAALFALGVNDANFKKSFRNMGNMLVEESRNLNLVDVLRYRYLVITNPETALEALENRTK